MASLMPEALAFAPASHATHLAWADPPVRSGWDAFDDLRLPRPGKLLLFDVHPDAEPLAERFLLGLLAGGLAAHPAARATLVPATGRPVDVWRLRQAAAALHLPRAALARLHVARPPPPHALPALPHEGVLLVDRLPEACLARRADALHALDDALARLREHARGNRATVLLPTSVLSGRSTKPLRARLLGAADEAIGLHPTPEGVLRVRVPGRGLELRAAPPEPVLA